MKSLFLFALPLALISCDQSDPVDVQEVETQVIVSPEPVMEKIDTIGKGVVTTIVDGVDIRNVNLWSSTKSDRRVICSLPKDHAIHILKEEGDYFQVVSAFDPTCKGYCMKSFISKK
jgi:hypothetical protein